MSIMIQIPQKQLAKALVRGAKKGTAERIVDWRWDDDWCEYQSVVSNVPVVRITIQNGETLELELSSSRRFWWWSGHLGGLRAMLLQQWLLDTGIQFSVDY